MREVIIVDEEEKVYKIPWYLKEGEPNWNMPPEIAYNFGKDFIKEVIIGDPRFRELFKAGQVYIDKFNLEAREGEVEFMSITDLSRVICKVVGVTDMYVKVTTKHCPLGYILDELVRDIPEQIRISNNFVANLTDPEPQIKWMCFSLNTRMREGEKDETVGISFEAAGETEASEL